MISLQNLEYNKKVVLDEYVNKEGNFQQLILSKTYCKPDNRNHYFITLYLVKPDGTYINQGYIYFFYHEQNKTIDFIGIFIKTEYRSKGLASLLVSTWIKLCLENDIIKLTTIQKQKKPFLIYLLKTYYFELKDATLYEKSKNVIHICRRENSSAKFLFFENENQRDLFMTSKIFYTDDYQILDTLEEDTEKLDTVILSKKYFLQDEEGAYKKALRIKKNQER